MLRSVGMSGRDFNKMMTYECVFTECGHFFTGLPLSAAASWLIYRGLASVEKWRISILYFLAQYGGQCVQCVPYCLHHNDVCRKPVKERKHIDVLRDDMT